MRGCPNDVAQMLAGAGLAHGDRLEPPFGNPGTRNRLALVGCALMLLGLFALKVGSPSACRTEATALQSFVLVQRGPSCAVWARVPGPSAVPSRERSDLVATVVKWHLVAK